LFSDKTLEKSHEKLFQKLMELSKKLFDKGKNIGSLPKKISSTKGDRYFEDLTL
jgi:hypothetical protein